MKYLAHIQAHLQAPTHKPILQLAKEPKFSLRTCPPNRIIAYI